ncbi:HpcH/HpaI aldolase/citrate lyase family protein [Phytopseudomonas dryadis]|uniref:CoA ester lyase n=1 Tax=Phytopseudomonas dryadis TaxID=2487520 RepID=A0A4Q9QYA8_9GAMM|nr:MULTISPECIES: CoA ester lyase [Pseudomonas]TBU90304.1 CoA ester lyase [Pseudomonas dryadis]TBV04436.1 CoA ester lyase [Pseudomonas dryadis]TBV17162.1 CoA ester lyase [Pseudomonas sp. FRB 230]
MAARSYLFVPGDRPERFDKACAAGADVVILDLEDAVAPERKDQAREAIRAWLTAGGQAWLRLNGSDTPWHAEDCGLFDAPGLLGVSLPKAESAAQLAELAARLPEPLRILPIVESARGLCNAEAIAAAPRVQCLAFGSVDFQVDTGILGDGEELLFARSRLVIASALARIGAPVDGVTVDLGNLEQLASDVRRARQQGFAGKLCVHPKQVAPINDGFRPAAQEVQWARRVLDSVAAHHGVGAISLDGKLIDLPVILRARRIVENA